MHELPGESNVAEKMHMQVNTAELPPMKLNLYVCIGGAEAAHSPEGCWTGSIGMAAA